MSEPRTKCSILTRPVSGPGAWRPEALATTDKQWIYRFSQRSLEEIDTALRTAARRRVPFYRLTVTDFPLPGLADDLDMISREIEQGRGFVQLKGLPVERYTEEEVRIIYWGIGCHLGTAVSQNAKGDLIGHVRNEGLSMGNGKVRGYQTSSASPFHVDECDVVGLLCLRSAKSGGLSRLVSSLSVYNELLARYPYYIAMLYEQFYFDWRGENPENTAPVYRWPVYEFHQDKLNCRYSRRMIEFGHQRIGCPLTDLQVEAFDILDRLIDELYLDIDFEPGDIQFLNNYTILHSRTRFEDYEDPRKRRHLLRLWLTARDGRRLSEAVTAERNVRTGVPVQGHSQSRPAPNS